MFTDIQSSILDTADPIVRGHSDNYRNYSILYCNNSNPLLSTATAVVYYLLSYTVTAVVYYLLSYTVTAVVYYPLSYTATAGTYYRLLHTVTAVVNYSLSYTVTAVAVANESARRNAQ